jgi:hypothetical protein
MWVMSCSKRVKKDSQVHMSSSNGASKVEGHVSSSRVMSYFQGPNPSNGAPMASKPHHHEETIVHDIIIDEINVQGEKGSKV